MPRHDVDAAAGPAADHQHVGADSDAVVAVGEVGLRAAGDGHEDLAGRVTPADADEDAADLAHRSVWHNAKYAVDRAEPFRLSWTPRFVGTLGQAR